MVKKIKEIDDIALELALAEDLEKKKAIYKEILDLAYEKGIYPSSINQFYMARGKESFGGFTVPAINLRTMTYDLAKAIFRVAKRINAGAFIFEIAKSEMGYTDQPPVEFTGLCVAAAIKEDYKGPVFIQGDHFQINAKKYKDNPKKEMDGMKALMEHAVEAGFYNIDIDSSTVVDLSKPTIEGQQELNCSICGELTSFIRSIQPAGIEISIGGEIGEVGGKNSTPEDLRAFMTGFNERLKKKNIGISKISIQTGTSHGGVILPDGTVAKVKLDFNTLKNLSKIAREEFGLAGAVQHGASTLPSEAFGKFPETDTAEVHLATEFQNIVYDSKNFPSELREKIYSWIDENLTAEKKEGQTQEQFIYKTRKKALGPFKKDILNLPAEKKEKIASEVEAKFKFLFDKLNVRNTKDQVSKYVTLTRVKKEGAKKIKDIELTGEGDD